MFICCPSLPSPLSIMVIPHHFTLLLQHTHTLYTPHEQSLTVVVGGAGCHQCHGVSPGCRLGCHLFVVPTLPASSPLHVSSPSSPHPCQPYSTHNPPHEQLLMRLGAGVCHHDMGLFHVSSSFQGNYNLGNERNKLVSLQKKK